LRAEKLRVDVLTIQQQKRMPWQKS
jgi:hypothetical protein